MTASKSRGKPMNHDIITIKYTEKNGFRVSSYPTMCAFKGCCQIIHSGIWCYEHGSAFLNMMANHEEKVKDGGA